MRTYSELNIDEMKREIHRMNKRRFIIQAIVFGVLSAMGIFGHLCTMQEDVVKILYILFILATPLFLSILVIYIKDKEPLFGAIYKYDLMYGKYSKRPIKEKRKE